MRDKISRRYLGKGVEQAVENVNKIIAKPLTKKAVKNKATQIQE